MGACVNFKWSEVCELGLVREHGTKTMTCIYSGLNFGMI